MRAYISVMGKTKLTGILMHVEPATALLLKELTEITGKKRSVLMREAIHALIALHSPLLVAERRRRKRASTKAGSLKKADSAN
jgi:predicted DNA-binding protein